MDVSGTVTYRQRIALTHDAVATVRLVDQSRADAPSETISEEVINNPHQVPIPFSLTYDPEKIIASHTCAVRAEISDRGRVMFRTTTAYLVITQDRPSQVDLVLEMMPQAPTPPSDAGVPLAGTNWVLREYAPQGIETIPARGEQRPTLAFGNDGRVSGNTGCNQYSGPYTQTGNQLSIGPLSSTLRACLDSELNAQERLMLQVLSGEVTSTRDGSRLVLMSPAGMLVFLAATIQNEGDV